MAAREWIEFEGGSTVGHQGSEKGITIRDEEHSRGARITLERDAGDVPFAITCGIYGWMVHTRFLGNQVDAVQEYEQMKIAMAGLMSKIPDAARNNEDDQQLSQVSSAIEDFVKMYP